MTVPCTLFLRLEGVLQAWGDTSKFVIRRTMDAPTKSGVIGLICCAMGLSRREARDHLPELSRLVMGVRIDRSGTRWWDWHTVGAGTGMTTAAGRVRLGAKDTLITRREYLADASFLVALQGDSANIERIRAALQSPKWPLWLGRKSCMPSRPVLESSFDADRGLDLKAALGRLPWYPRYDGDARPEGAALPCLLEWRPADEEDVAPADAEVWYDSPVSFEPPVHEPRLVVRNTVCVTIGDPIQLRSPVPPRPRANYANTAYRKRREERIQRDGGLCVFCKAPGPRMTVQHVTYRRAGGNESLEDLRSLCALCHDAVTMIEYGLGMGLDRIDPEDPRWRNRIVEQRRGILRFRSLETRRRWLDPEEV